MVGTARFELATPCTPSKCATRLRHVPSQSGCQTSRMGFQLGTGIRPIPIETRVSLEKESVLRRNRYGNPRHASCLTPDCLTIHF